MVVVLVVAMVVVVVVMVVVVLLETVVVVAVVVEVVVVVVVVVVVAQVQLERTDKGLTLISFRISSHWKMTKDSFSHTFNLDAFNCRW